MKNFFIFLFIEGILSLIDLLVICVLGKISLANFGIGLCLVWLVVPLITPLLYPVYSPTIQRTSIYVRQATRGQGGYVIPPSLRKDYHEYNNQQGEIEEEYNSAYKDIDISQAEFLMFGVFNIILGVILATLGGA